MKKAAAVALIVLGLGIIGVLLTFDWKNISSFGTAPVSMARTVSAASVERLNVETSSMDVRLVRGTSDDIYVKVEGKASEKFLEDFDLSADESNGTVTIKGEYKSRFTIGLNIVMVDMVIELPERLWEQVEVNSNSGNVEMEGINAKQVNINASSSDIELERLVVQEARLLTNSGKIELEDIEADRLELTANSGNIDVDQYSVKALQFLVKSGNVELKDGSGNVEGEAYSGDIRLEMEKLAGDVKLKACTT
jgi:lia operon protein LiaG